MDVLRWPGGQNVRDLGGRALRAGGRTPFGKVFRSAAPEHLTDEGWAAAKAVACGLWWTCVTHRPKRSATRTIRSSGPSRCTALLFVPAPTEDPDGAEFLQVCGRSWTIRAAGPTTRDLPRTASPPLCGPSPERTQRCSCTARAAGTAPA